MPIVILGGEDLFRLDRALKKFLEKEASGIAIQTFESNSAEDIRWQLLEFFRTRSLWQEPKVAVAKIPSWRGNLPEIPTPDLLILILEKTPPAGISKKARVETFPALKAAELFKWIRESAKELGNTAAPDLVLALVTLHGSDTAAIWNELVLLSCFKPDEKLSAEDLKTFRSWVPRPKDFAFVEAVLAKNRKQAVRFLFQNLNEGIEPMKILGGLEAHFRAMLVAKSGDKTAQDFFSGKHPFWVSKIKYAAMRFEEKELKASLRRIERALLAIKTGKHSPKTALEEFVIGA
jgi:DNA polymerase III delta subunit